jgi:hypothetical protein
LGSLSDSCPLVANFACTLSCPSDGDFNQYVFTGIKFNDNTKTFQFDSPKTSAEAFPTELTNGTDHMSRVHDGGMFYRVADGSDNNELGREKVPSA